jgi:3-oxoacyl-[acyl-carrier protein] reductase
VDLGLQGKACIVTGATRGIGRATVRMLHAEGARVLLVARDADELADVSGEVGGEFLAADVTDPDAAERIVATCAERFGTVDVLVNNAGTSSVRSLEELTDDDWQLQWELHVMGPMRLMRAAGPRMAAAGGGRIVNVCSSAGKRPSLTNAAYAVTKAAQLSLSRVFADRYAADAVLVNAVAPGAVSSPLWTAAGASPTRRRPRAASRARRRSRRRPRRSRSGASPSRRRSRRSSSSSARRRRAR